MTQTDLSTPPLNLAPRVRVLRSLKQWIGAGRIPNGECLPTENVLATEFGVARATLRGALKQLETEGLIRSQGRRRIVVGDGEPMSTVVSHTVAFMVDGPGRSRGKLSGWESFIQTGVSDAIREAGLHGLILEASLLSGERIQRLISEHPRGVIVLRQVVQSAAGREFVSAVRDAGIPVVGYAHQNELENCDTVASDHTAGAYQLTKWLIARGRKGILRYWHGSWEPASRPAWVSQRDVGYERAMVEAGLPIMRAIEPPQRTWEGGIVTHEQSVRFAVSYLAEHLVRPGVDALMLASDGLIPSAAGACRLLGRKPNVDIDLVGYDHYWADVPEHELEKVPPLATVDKQNVEIGRALVDLLLARIAGNLPPEPQHRLVEPALVIED